MNASPSPPYNGGYPHVADDERPGSPVDNVCESLRSIGDDAARKKDRVLQLMLDQLQSTNTAASKVEDLVRHLRGSSVRRSRASTPTPLHETETRYSSPSYGRDPEQNAGYVSRIRQLEYDLQLQRDAHTLVVKDLQDQVLPACTNRADTLRSEVDTLWSELRPLRDENAQLQKSNSHLVSRAEELELSLQTARALADAKSKDAVQVREACAAAAAASETKWATRLAEAENLAAREREAAEQRLDEEREQSTRQRLDSEASVIEAETRAAARVAELEDMHQEDMAGLRQRMEASVAQANAEAASCRADGSQRLAAAETSFAARLAEAEQIHAEEVERVRADLEAMVDDMQSDALSYRDQGSARLAAAEAGHEAHASELSRQHDEDMQELRADCEARIESLRREYEEKLAATQTSARDTLLLTQGEGLQKLVEAETAGVQKEESLRQRIEEMEAEHDKEVRRLQHDAQALQAEARLEVQRISDECIQAVKDSEAGCEKRVAELEAQHAADLAQAEAAGQERARQHITEGQDALLEAQEEGIRSVAELQASNSTKVRDMEVAHAEQLKSERAASEAALQEARVAAETYRRQTIELVGLAEKSAQQVEERHKQHVADLQAQHNTARAREQKDAESLIAEVRAHVEARTEEAIRIHKSGEAALKEAQVRFETQLAERESVHLKEMQVEKQESDDRLRVSERLLIGSFEADLKRLEDATAEEAQRREQDLRDEVERVKARAAENLDRRIRDVELAAARQLRGVQQYASQAKARYAEELGRAGDALSAARAAVEREILRAKSKFQQAEDDIRSEATREVEKLRLRHGEVCAERVALEGQMAGMRAELEEAASHEPRMAELRNTIAELKAMTAEAQNARRAAEAQLAAEVAAREAAEEEAMQAAQKMATAVAECERERRHADLRCDPTSPSSARTAPSASASPAETRHVPRHSGRRSDLAVSPELAYASTATRPQMETPEAVFLETELPPPPADLPSRDLDRGVSNLTGNTARYERAIESISLRAGSLHTLELESRTTSWIREHPAASSVQSGTLKPMTILCTPSEFEHDCTQTEPPLTALQLDGDGLAFEDKLSQKLATDGTPSGDQSPRNGSNTTTPVESRTAASPDPSVDACGAAVEDEEESSELVAFMHTDLPPPPCAPLGDGFQNGDTLSDSSNLSEQAEAIRNTLLRTPEPHEGMYPHPPDAEVEAPTPQAVAAAAFDPIPSQASTAPQRLDTVQHLEASLGRVSSMVSVSEASLRLTDSYTEGAPQQDAAGDTDPDPDPDAEDKSESQAQPTDMQSVQSTSKDMVSVVQEPSPRHSMESYSPRSLDAAAAGFCSAQAEALLGEMSPKSDSIQVAWGDGGSPEKGDCISPALASAQPPDGLEAEEGLGASGLSEAVGGAHLQELNGCE